LWRRIDGAERVDLDPRDIVKNPLDQERKVNYSSTLPGSVGRGSFVRLDPARSLVEIENRLGPIRG
jgi:hypothetical protein